MLRNDEKSLDVLQNLASTSAIASLRWGLIGAVDVFFLPLAIQVRVDSSRLDGFRFWVWSPVMDIAILVVFSITFLD